MGHGDEISLQWMEQRDFLRIYVNEMRIYLRIDEIVVYN